MSQQSEIELIEVHHVSFNPGPVGVGYGDSEVGISKGSTIEIHRDGVAVQTATVELCTVNLELCKWSVGVQHGIELAVGDKLRLVGSADVPNHPSLILATQTESVPMPEEADSPDGS